MIKLRSPIPKRCTFSPKAPFPVNIFESEDVEEQPIYYGRFNGFNVVVEKHEDMIALYTMGYFGKGSLSQGYPAFDEKRQKRLEKEQQTEEEKKINLKKNHATDSHDIEKRSDIEHLHLMLEEAFFLSFVLECFIVSFNDKVMDVNLMWKTFQNVQPFFVERYATYHYFRARGWVVKPGLKYGGDFLLYKQGPPFYHASAVVIIVSNINEYMRNIDCDTLIAVNRAVEVARKELLIAQIYIPPDFNYQKVNEVSRCTISEYIFKRHMPTV